MRRNWGRERRHALSPRTRSIDRRIPAAADRGGNGPMKHLIGNADILFITLDTLRYDAAQHAWKEGRLKTLRPYLGETGWEKRHTPGSFTYAAHHAFFSGFLPTPFGPGPHPRLFAAQFAGSISTVEDTFAFQEA